MELYINPRPESFDLHVEIYVDVSSVKIQQGKLFLTGDFCGWSTDPGVCAEFVGRPGFAGTICKGHGCAVGRIPRDRENVQFKVFYLRRNGGRFQGQPEWWDPVTVGASKQLVRNGNICLQLPHIAGDRKFVPGTGPRLDKDKDCYVFGGPPAEHGFVQNHIKHYLVGPFNEWKPSPEYQLCLQKKGIEIRADTIAVMYLQVQRVEVPRIQDTWILNAHEPMVPNDLGGFNELLRPPRVVKYFEKEAQW